MTIVLDCSQDIVAHQTMRPAPSRNETSIEKGLIPLFSIHTNERHANASLCTQLLTHGNVFSDCSCNCSITISLWSRGGYSKFTVTTP